MPPVRTNQGRASKACRACRNNKTRCYATGPGSMTCLRCQTLGKECSFQHESPNKDIPDLLEQRAHSELHDCRKMEQRVRSLELTVQIMESVLVNLQQPVVRDTPIVTLRVEDNDTAAPLQVIHDAIPDPTRPWQEQDTRPEANIVRKNILSADEADRLLAIFQRNYGRWLSIPETVITTLRSADVKDALFMCALCLVAARHSLTDLNAGLSISLFAEAKILLGNNLLQPRRPLTFFQALLVLSLWSSTVGQHSTSLDAWLITGMAIQQGLISDSVKNVAMGKIREIDKETQLESLYLWNHLCLSHLHACITMRRKAMINVAHVRQARLVTNMLSSSNFEVRMAAELCLYWTVYEELETETVNVQHAQMALQSWKTEWNFLFTQERHHFLQMGFSFAQLLILERALDNSSEAVDESMVAQMLQYCSGILQAAIRTPDDRTEHLTHHVYHMITFAALTLSRLLRKDGKELASSSEIASCHVLIVETSQWLRSIGLPGHIGRTMGNIVATLYQSLFPTQESDPTRSFQANLDFEDFTGMPEFFDLDANFDWDSLE